MRHPVVCQVSPWWKEEQHRRGHICFLAVGEVPRQSHLYCTCDKVNADGVSISTGEGEAMKENILLFNMFLWRKTVLMPAPCDIIIILSSDHHNRVFVD